ncbi:iron-sulfur cluster biosynthesis family protein, partial [Vibrio harveyi]
STTLTRKVNVVVVKASTSN